MVGLAVQGGEDSVEVGPEGLPEGSRGTCIGQWEARTLVAAEAESQGSGRGPELGDEDTPVGSETALWAAASIRNVTGSRATNSRSGGGHQRAETRAELGPLCPHQGAQPGALAESGHSLGCRTGGGAAPCPTK